MASLTTQSVTVPIDVISQKQMVHGDETVVARHQQRHGASAVPSVASTPLPSEAPMRQGGGVATSGAAAGSGLRVENVAAVATQQPSATSTRALAPSTTATRPATASTSAPSVAAIPLTPGTSLPSAPPTSSRAASRTSAAASTTGRPVQSHLHVPQSPTTVARRIGALQMVRLILKEEGLGGLYRGFGPSVATFVPSSAIWWGSYGTYQKLIWNLRQQQLGSGVADAQMPLHSTSEVVAVQTMSSVLAGFTSGLVTTPVDLVKVSWKLRCRFTLIPNAQVRM